MLGMSEGVAGGIAADGLAGPSWVDTRRTLAYVMVSIHRQTKFEMLTLLAPS